MAEKDQNNLSNVDNEKLEKVKSTLGKLTNKESKVIFFVAESTNPSASVYEIYFLAKTLADQGYDVSIYTDKVDYTFPYYLDSDMKSLDHVAMEQAKLSVGAQDVLIIPEIFTNVMEQTKNLPCMRVVFLQSFDYMMNGLLPSTDWSTFGIKDVLTTSNTLKDMVNEFFGEGKFNIVTYDIGIPDYFKQTENDLKRPVISVIGRNPNEVSKVIKLFYNKYPQYSWLTFDTMITNTEPVMALKRSEFAKRMRTNFATLWIDRISSFGTVGLESMAAGSIPIGLMPEITPDYLLDGEEYIEHSGVWTSDLYALPILIGETLSGFIDDTIPQKIYDSMEKVSSKYSVENSKNTFMESFNAIINKRVSALEQFIADIENAEKDKAEKE
jgi:hypothetical protein